MSLKTETPTQNAALAKGYEFHQVEEKWLAEWNIQRTFEATLDTNRPGYAIVIPPPNVTGVLHVGHALNNTLQDVLVRFRRMQGHNTLWLPGTDHAGIATQNVVERQLASEGTSRHEMGRDAFIERVWQWKKEKGDNIINQLKRLGCSCDWSRERFTMDEGLSRAVREVFVRLYKEGLIYKGDYIVNWCPRCRTALADDEVEHEPTDGKLYHIRYPYADNSGYLVVATTRPETMLGDTGVAVHPDDERYNALGVQSVLLPLTGRTIPLVFDTHVQKDFGTGALKVTPAHDRDDYEIGRRHGLAIMKVMDNNGNMNEAAGENYKGLERFACRKKIVADLEEQGFLDKIEPYQHGVGHCYRCHTVVESITSVQWFVSVRPLADKASQQVRDGKIRILPKIWDNTFYNWMDNIRDWCISRQIWWGHRIPAWTCTQCGEIIVETEDPTTCSACNSTDLEQEVDVLDTWFSSALWPFSTLGWPDKTPELAMYYPTSVLITSFDILFFWVARMMMMGIHFMDDVPFRDVYLHALVRDKFGKKMSKSTGNVIDPLEVMDTYGTDALRFTLTAFAAQGRDIRLDEDRIEGYRHFINKIWNAARFALMHLQEENIRDLADIHNTDLSLANQWILSRTSRAVTAVTTALDNYHYNDAAHAAYHFVWHEFCDWYLEWIKSDLYGDDPAAKEQSLGVLAAVLDTLIRLLHPFIPFVTEEIWHALPGKRGLVMIESFPKAVPAWEDDQIEQTVNLLFGVITGIRNIRSETGIHPSDSIVAHVLCQDQEKRAIITAQQKSICTLTRLAELVVKTDGARPKGAASYIFEDITLYVDLEGLIDIENEMEKLGKERDKVLVQFKKVEDKLGNATFVDRAPAEIVDKEKEKRDVLSGKLAKIEESLNRLKAMAK